MTSNILLWGLLLLLTAVAIGGLTFWTSRRRPAPLQDERSEPRLGEEWNDGQWAELQGFVEVDGDAIDPLKVIRNLCNEGASFLLSPAEHSHSASAAHPDRRAPRIDCEADSNLARCAPEWRGVFVAVRKAATLRDYGSLAALCSDAAIDTLLQRSAAAWQRHTPMLLTDLDAELLSVQRKGEQLTAVVRFHPRFADENGLLTSGQPEIWTLSHARESSWVVTKVHSPGQLRIVKEAQDE